VLTLLKKMSNEMQGRIKFPVKHPSRCRDLLAVMVGAFPPTQREQHIADVLDRLPDAELLVASLVAAEMPVAEMAVALDLTPRRIYQLVQNTKRLLAPAPLDCEAA
jgi:hypothetical protein